MAYTEINWVKSLLISSELFFVLLLLIKKHHTLSLLDGMRQVMVTTCIVMEIKWKHLTEIWVAIEKCHLLGLTIFYG
jgi:hypothetical protein